MVQIELYEQLVTLHNILKKMRQEDESSYSLEIDPVMDLPYPPRIKEQRLQFFKNLVDNFCNENLDELIIAQSKRGVSNEKTNGKNKNRGTNLRGVSKNGRNNWQILCFEESNKVYLGTVDDITKATLRSCMTSLASRTRVKRPRPTLAIRPGRSSPSSRLKV